MSRGTKGSIAGMLTLVVAGALSTSSAAADGLPVTGVSAGKSGVALPGADDRYTAVRAGAGTFIARTSQADGSILESTQTAGRLTIPAVAYDATAAGLSADGSTLVLIRPRRAFPQRDTHLAIYDAPKLDLRDRITLRGDFSYDALSPDGSVLYLIEYENPKNPAEYAVRAYDVRRGELRPDPIVDPSEAGEQMAGYPMTRVTSPDGRWEYTLYDGSDGEPFVHALDTQAGTAACIDLPQLEGRAGYRLDLEVDPAGGALTVLLKHEPALAIDPEGFEVSAIPEEPIEPGPAKDESGLPWTLLAIGLGAGLLAGAGFYARRHRSQSGPPVTEADLAALVELDEEHAAAEPEPPIRA